MAPFCPFVVVLLLSPQLKKGLMILFHVESACSNERTPPQAIASFIHLALLVFEQFMLLNVFGYTLPNSMAVLLPCGLHIRPYNWSLSEGFLAFVECCGPQAFGGK